MIPIYSAIPMIALSLIERYGNEASAHVANRIRLLEACGDRQTSRTWDLICREIKKFEMNSVRGEPEIESVEQTEKLGSIYAPSSEIIEIDLAGTQPLPRVWLVWEDGQSLNQYKCCRA
jgi:hypothetical protein